MGDTLGRVNRHTYRDAQFRSVCPNKFKATGSFVVSLVAAAATRPATRRIAGLVEPVGQTLRSRAGRSVGSMHAVELENVGSGHGKLNRMSVAEAGETSLPE